MSSESIINIDLEELLNLLKILFKICEKCEKCRTYVQVLKCLLQGPKTFRNLAQCVNIASKNLKKYVDFLKELGLITEVQVSSKLYVYMLNQDVVKYVKYLSNLT